MVWQSEAVRNWKGERVLKEKKSLLIWGRQKDTKRTVLKERQDEEITVFGVKKIEKAKKEKKEKTVFKKKR